MLNRLVEARNIANAPIVVVVVSLLLGGPIASAWAGTGETAITECLKQLRLSRKACTCIGAKAESDLNAKQQKLFVAVITGDKQAQASAQADMTVNEMTETGDFMDRAPRECAGQ